MEPSPSAHPWAQSLQTDGFATVSNLYSAAEVAALLTCVEDTLGEGPDDGPTPAVFAIRDLLEAVPRLWNGLNTPALRALLAEVFPGRCHLVKAMYFDKPSLLNWRVP